jgi:hypothetical protein
MASRETARVEEQVRAKPAAMVRAGAKKAESIRVLEQKIPIHHKTRRIYHARIKSERSHE